MLIKTRKNGWAIMLGMVCMMAGVAIGSGLFR